MSSASEGHNATKFLYYRYQACEAELLSEEGIRQALGNIDRMTLSDNRFSAILPPGRDPATMRLRYSSLRPYGFSRLTANLGGVSGFTASSLRPHKPKYKPDKSHGNHDRLLIIDSERYLIAAVADGVGPYSSDASEAVLQGISNWADKKLEQQNRIDYLRHSMPFVRQALHSRYRALKQIISHELPFALLRQATTMSAILLRQIRGYFLLEYMYQGDSRLIVYSAKDRQVKFQTKDQVGVSFISRRQVDGTVLHIPVKSEDGRIKIGVNSNLIMSNDRPDTFNEHQRGVYAEESGVTQIQSMILEPGDIYILTTDGMLTVLGNGDQSLGQNILLGIIQEILDSGQEIKNLPARAIQSAVEMALELARKPGGSDDNIAIQMGMIPVNGHEL